MRESTCKRGQQQTCGKMGSGSEPWHARAAQQIGCPSLVVTVTVQCNLVNNNISVLPISVQMAAAAQYKCVSGDGQPIHVRATRAANTSQYIGKHNMHIYIYR